MKHLLSLFGMGNYQDSDLLCSWLGGLRQARQCGERTEAVLSVDEQQDVPVDICAHAGGTQTVQDEGPGQCGLPCLCGTADQDGVCHRVSQDLNLGLFPGPGVIKFGQAQFWFCCNFYNRNIFWKSENELKRKKRRAYLSYMATGPGCDWFV